MTTDHITKDWFNEKVRQTEDGKASVLDLIRNAITGRGERVVWHRLKAENPELEQLVDTVSFPDGMGRTGKNTLTPVVDLEGWLQILPLLPGAAGKKYRKATAELVVRIWRGDADLGLAIMMRDTDKARLARAKARLRVADGGPAASDHPIRAGRIQQLKQTRQHLPQLGPLPWVVDGL
jgi:hypothetical protein